MSLIKKGDKVQVCSGRDRGKIGNVIKVYRDKNKAIVEGVNLITKYIRRRSENEPGGRKEIPQPIVFSALALYCSSCQKGVRVGSQRNGKERSRICKKCQQVI